MALIFYNIFLFLFKFWIGIFSFWNSKVLRWKRGRENILPLIQQAIKSDDKIIWFHCASLGEFEQGRPIIENLRKQEPSYKILITFFSSSGYDVRKDYKGVDYIFYLPMDSKKNAEMFLDIVNPSLVIFIKYEFWYYYLSAIYKRNIPILLVSALFRREQPFFKWYGSLHRKMLSFFTQIFLQDSESEKLLDKIGIKGKTIVSGDTRFDRVIEIAEQPVIMQDIINFIGDKKAIIAGSTWKDDEEILQRSFTGMEHFSLKLIIAPHEINRQHLQDLKKLFPGSVFYSEIQTGIPCQVEVLLIDNIGMLSKLYRFGYITFVGGGFTSSGIHNTLEAAVYAKPVLFGPNYKKHQEAKDLVAIGGAFSCDSAITLKQILISLLSDTEMYKLRCEASKNYVIEKKGATKKVIQYIQENRLLTRK